MKAVNQTIDAPSPLLQYGAGWYMVTSNANNYQGQAVLNGNTVGTGMTTQATNDAGTVTLNFNGTSVWVYGSKRASHATFDARLDSTAELGLSTNAPAGQELYQTLIYNATGLPSGPHILTLTNTGGGPNGYLDVDYVLIELQVADDASTNIVEDTDSSFQYIPSQGSYWDSTSEDPRDRSNTSHFTTSDQGKLQFDFVGEAVALYGQVNSNHGLYKVSIDGGQELSLNGSWATQSYQQTLFHASGLGQGKHTLLLSNVPQSQGPEGKNWFEFDYGQTWGTNAVPKSSSSTSSAGAIAGGVIGGVVGLALIAALLWFFLARRNKRRRYHGEKADLIAPASNDSLQGTHITPFVQAYRDNEDRASDADQTQSSSSYNHAHNRTMSSTMSGDGTYVGYPPTRNRQSYNYPETPPAQASTYRHSAATTGVANSTRPESSDFAGPESTRARHDSDAGPLFSTNPDEFGGLLPPTYDTLPAGSSNAGSVTGRSGQAPGTSGFRDEKGSRGPSRSLRAVNEEAERDDDASGR